MSRLSVAVVATCAAFAAVPVAGAASTSTRAKRAVLAEVEARYVPPLRGVDVYCDRLTARRFKCSYDGFDSDLKPCRGTARATVYPRSVDVTSVSRFRCAYGF